MFIARAREVHGDKYDYSKTVYENMHSKVLIICPRHGEFYQRAQSHLLGSGCPMCKYDAHMDRIRKMMEQIQQGEGTNDSNNVEIAKLPQNVGLCIQYSQNISIFAKNMNPL
jgi:hypothetical protein